MIAVTVTSNLRELQRSLTLLQAERLPSVMRNALNDVAMDARNAERAEIARVFDRPTPLTKSAVVFPKHLKATKDSLVATIGMLRDEAARGTPPSKYLAPQVAGGARKPKKHEIALRRVGLLGPDEFAVPASGTRLNSYGNIPGSTILQILSQLKAAESFAGYAMNETRRSRKRAGARRMKRYFVPRQPHSLSPGVYERSGRTIRAVLIFVKDTPDYRRRYAFGKAGEKVVQLSFERHYVKHFNKIFKR